MQLYFMHWQKSGFLKVPKTWMKNPEKWQKLGKINPKKKPSQKLIARHLVKSGRRGGPLQIYLFISFLEKQNI